MGSVTLILIGFLALSMMVYGVLSVFDGSRSDDPMSMSGRATVDDGIRKFVVGAVILVAVIVFSVWRWFHGA